MKSYTIGTKPDVRKRVENNTKRERRAFPRQSVPRRTGIATRLRHAVRRVCIAHRRGSHEAHAGRCPSVRTGASECTCGPILAGK